MACGCGSKRAAEAVEDVDARAGRAVTQAALCATCRHGVRVDGRTEACGWRGPEGVRVDLRVVVAGMSPCPVGRHADARGEVELGLRWRGLPEPDRWKMAMRGLTAEPPGCGCVAVMVDGPERWVVGAIGWVSRSLRRWWVERGRQAWVQARGDVRGG